MNKYKLVIDNLTDAYILDTEENKIVALCNAKVTLCNTKRPDLRFNELQELVDNANENLKKNKENNKGKQKFQLGDTVYIIDDDYNFFESEIYRIELSDGKYYYTSEWDFEDKDIGDWVFTSELERELHIEALIF